MASLEFIIKTVCSGHQRETDIYIYINYYISKRAWLAVSVRQAVNLTLELTLFRTIQSCKCNHSCQPLLGVNLSPEFVNLYFPYAGQGLLFFRWWQWHFEFQLACVAMEGRSNVVLICMHNVKSHTQRDFLAFCTMPVSVLLAMECVGCSFDSFSVFLLNLF